MSSNSQTLLTQVNAALCTCPMVGPGYAAVYYQHQLGCPATKESVVRRVTEALLVAVSQERERCAIIADTAKRPTGYTYLMGQIADDIARKIRAGGVPT